MLPEAVSIKGVQDGIQAGFYKLKKLNHVYMFLT